MVERLLRVEKADEPTEIVIHVNMLKEGWDVTNLYTIVPLRAANARTLVEQSIRRGLRLPYGERVGLVPIDRLNIVAHDRFQEIVDDANKPDSPLRVQAGEIPAEELQRRVVTVESHSILAERLGVAEQSPLPAVKGNLLRPRRSLDRQKNALSWPPQCRRSKRFPVALAICRVPPICAERTCRLAWSVSSRRATASSSRRRVCASP
jgi:superfamily II DNA or RNA helicase